MDKRKLVIIGYGSLGQFLTRQAMDSSAFEVVAIFNRTVVSDPSLPQHLSVKKLEQLEQSKEVLQLADLVVEVAHPSVTKEFVSIILSSADYFIGSPTALADDVVLANVKRDCIKFGRSVYVPSGAFWGGEDIRKMADSGTLQSLSVTMAKHPSCFRLESPLREKNQTVTDSAVTLYEGPVRDLCKLAPNNVNTMAAACIAAHTLGFDRVIGRLVSDPGLAEYHVVRVCVEGINGFQVSTERRNPAGAGAVTGSATYHSFLASLNAANGKPTGIHLC